MVQERPNFPTLPFDTIGPPLRIAGQFAINKVDREWPVKWRDLPGAAVLVETLLRASENTYQTILHLCVEEPNWPQRPEYVLSVGPLNRTLLDTLFTLVFLFENPRERSEWYYCAGWLEMRDERDRHIERYKDDPSWEPWLSEFSQGLDGAAENFRIPLDVREGRRRVPRWPLPGMMKVDPNTAADRREYLSHLYDWHYKALSSQAHMSLPGLIMRSNALKRVQGEEEVERVWMLDKQRSDNAAVAIVLWLSIISEIEIEMRFGQAAKLLYVWRVLTEYFGLAQEIYDLRAGRLLRE